MPELLEALRHRSGLRRAFERTAGDEVQGLLDDAAAVTALAVDLLRREVWSVGIGVGAVDVPLARSVRAGRGPAFVLARSAVDRAKSAPHPICVAGTDVSSAERAESGLWLLAAVLARRSAAGWEAVEAMHGHNTQREAARSLGISAQAMSRRLAVAGWPEERRGRDLVAHLLQEAT